MSRVEVAHLTNAALGEGPIWDVDRQVLHFIDIFGKKINQFDPARGTLHTIAIDGTPGSLTLRKDGSYLAGVDKSFVNIAPDGALTPIASVGRGDRMNDGKCDPRGRFVAGTMSNQEVLKTAGLYQMDVDGTVVELLSDVTLSNGLDWSPDGTRFYHIDTTPRQIYVYDYDLDTGEISDRQLLVDLSDFAGRPDGLTVDAEGGIWVAMPRVGKVHRYEASGRLDEVIDMPTSRVTSCAFGGPRLDQLFVTSSRALLAEPERTTDPVAGALFVIEGLGVKGRPPYRFGA